MKTISLLLIILLFLPALLLGQNKKTDSLQKVIATTKIDTVKGRTLCRLCAMLELTEDYETGIQKGEEGLAISEKKKDQKGIASCLNTIGNIYRKKGNSPKALDYFQKGLAVSEQIKDNTMIASYLNNIGIIYKNQGNSQKALEYYTKGLSFSNKSGDKKTISACLNNIGTIYLNKKEYPKALEYYQKSIAIKESIGDKRGVSSSLDNIGIIHFEQKNYPKALEYHKKAEIIREQTGNKQGLAVSLHNQGRVYKEQKNYTQALEYYQKSLNLFEQIGDKASISVSNSYIGEIYLHINKLVLAKEYINKGLKIAQEVNYLEYLHLASLLSYRIDTTFGDYKSAVEHYKLYQQYSDSLNVVEDAKELGRLESERQFEKETEAKNKELALQAERRTRYYYLLGGIFTLVLAGTGFIFYRYRTKEKNNRLLTSKNELITTQKVELENAYKELNVTMEQVKYQSEDIQHKNHKIEDSIRYALQIQTAILPDPDYLQAVLPPHFIFYQPKDIVSGDFYQCYQVNGLLFVIVADCTGHGVPGAFMSVVGNNALYNAIHVLQLTDPDVILSELDRLIRQILKQESGSESKDGMDLALLIFSTEKAFYAGAGRPLYWIRNGTLTEIKGDKFPIGGSQYDHKTFTTHEIVTQKGDRFYLFSDGITDQFGGERNKKFTPKRLQEFISEHQNDSLPEQGRLFTQIMTNWMKDQKQLDDLTLIGIEM